MQLGMLRMTLDETEPDDTNTMTRQSSSSSTEFVDRNAFIAAFNKILPMIGIAPIDAKKISKSHSYCRNTLNEISEGLARKIFDVFPAKTASVVVEEENTDQEIVNQLKVKFAETIDKHSKIKILSVLPRSWSARRISREFHTTVHLGLLTKALVEENGILCGPKKRVATIAIDEETVHLVKDFFSSDEISRVCAGKRDYVTINENNVKVAKQRRLMLMNLEEAYALFKQSNIGRQIGFSKFATLRPKECILPLNNVGTHAVCVCSYHQNVKLIFEPLKRILKIDTYRNLFQKMLCIEATTDCHLMQCEECPGIQEMEKYFADLLEKAEIDDVSYMQWIHQNGKHKLY